MAELRKYQQRAILKLRETILAGHRKIVMALPTGAGKSIVFGQIISNAIEKGNKVLWLVHRRNLVYQMKDVLENHFEIEAGVIMSGVESNTTLPCQVGTIQTYIRRLKLSATFDNNFFIDADLVLIDEGHRSLSKTYMDTISLYKDKAILACTATPMRADQRGMGEVYSAIVDIAGVQELTDKGYLSPARYFAPTTPDLDGVKIAMGDYVVKQLDAKINKEKLNGDIVDNWLRNGENRKTLVFCINVKHSMAVCEEFQENGVNAEHLDARSSDEVRDEVFLRMEKGDTQVICNVGLYQEGLDVPNVSCIVMARPTKSMGLYRQCCGRGLRVSPGKEDCIIFDHGGVIEEHGFLEDELEWSLDGKKQAWKKREPKENEPKTVICRVCHQVFKGLKACPVCGTELRSFGKKIETVDVELVELKAKKKINKDLTWDEKRIFFGGLLYYAENKGYKRGWAAHAYRTYTGVWPNDKRVSEVSPIRPEGQAKNLLQHVLIKKAAQYKKKMEANGQR